jgi:spore maturation protein CgeB
MLGERTDEHLAHFADGEEAAFFDGPEELIEKVDYYLTHADERRRIATAGRARCLRSAYSYDDRLAAVLEELAVAA